MPQGPWFPWSREFRRDRFPWQGTTRREHESLRDQRDLAVLVEAASTTIGVVVSQLGFAFRPDAAGVSRLNGPRQAAVLYEAKPGDVDRRLRLDESETDSCIDLWIYWSPDTGRLDLILPGTLRTRGPDHVEREELLAALQGHADQLAQQLAQDG